MRSHETERCMAKETVNQGKSVCRLKESSCLLYAWQRIHPSYIQRIKRNKPGAGVCCQAWCPEFKHPNPHRREEPTHTNCSVMPLFCSKHIWTHVHEYTCSISAHLHVMASMCEQINKHAQMRRCKKIP